jgi:2-dehydro-3-deoxyphosphogluconate aldolase/(4S)-4-hydroxy-2-oxoglutarate aldolase
MSFRNIIHNHRVIAVLTIDKIEAAAPLAQALLEGGVGAMELTLRTPVAMEAIRTVKRELPEMLLGAGTVLTTDQVEGVKEAGADFAVAPGTNSRVIRHAAEIGLPFAPGIATPSDIERALENGCEVLKYFPAETSGGLKNLQNISKPYEHLGLGFIPLGGIHAENMADYLQEACVTSIGGSWIATPALIETGDWTTISANARAAAEAARQID